MEREEEEEEEEEGRKKMVEKMKIEIRYANPLCSVVYVEFCIHIISLYY